MGGDTRLHNLLVFALSLYLFLLAISTMGSALKSMGKNSALYLLKEVHNPLLGLVAGILTTSIVQSSSLTTSLAVSLVASNLLNLELAIAIIMGANIGTTITNTLVSLVHMRRRNEFQLAFEGAVIHDVFNILTVLVLFPLEIFFHPIKKFSETFTLLLYKHGGLRFTSPLKLFLEPLQKPIVKFFTAYTHGGYLLITLSLFCLFFSLKYLSNSMRRLTELGFEKILDEYLFHNPFIAFGTGLLLTALIQSSSVSTSLLIPLLGTGILTLQQVYPYTLGANVGTTITAILAAMATISTLNATLNGLTIALAHLLFNILGIAIWYPLRNIPFMIARKLAHVASRDHRIVLAYIALTFYAIPLTLLLIL